MVLERWCGRMVRGSNVFNQAMRGPTVPGSCLARWSLWPTWLLHELRRFLTREPFGTFGSLTLAVFHTDVDHFPAGRGRNAAPFHAQSQHWCHSQHRADRVA